MQGGFRLFGTLVLVFCIPELFASSSSWQKVQYSEQQLTVGKILVASEKLADPNFAESVVLIVQFDAEEGTVGLVINRPTQLPISRIFPKTKPADKDPVYMGGPVGITAVQALLRLSERAGQATHVVGDVYLTGAKELMEQSIVSQSDPSKFRLYLGYAGWSAGQLQAEMRLGAWSIISGSSKIIFDRNPDSLWSRLTQSSRMQIAFGVPFVRSLDRAYGINREVLHKTRLDVPNDNGMTGRRNHPLHIEAVELNGTRKNDPVFSRLLWPQVWRQAAL